MNEEIEENNTEKTPKVERALPPDAVTQDMSGAEFGDIVSGAFDTVQDSADLMPPIKKRVLMPESDQPKLHKVLAQAGMGGRLEMEAAIEAGRVKVNDEAAHVGMRVQRGDKIELDNSVVQYRLEGTAVRILAYHKPAGEVVTHDDPQNRPTVFRKLPKLRGGKWQSVGRLDLNTEGLLLFTNSGELANRLMHPRFGLEREYAVRVLGALNNEEKEKLLSGVTLEDGDAKFGSIEDGGGEGANCWYKVTIGEGRNREVRRMVESLGHAVSRLIRIRYGKVQLPRGLKRGYWIELGADDVGSLQTLTGVEGLEESASQGGERREGAQGEPRGRNRRGRFGRVKPASDGTNSGSERHGSKAQVPHKQTRLAKPQREQLPREQAPRGDYDDDFEANDPNPNHINPERTSVDFAKNRRGGGGFGGGVGRGRGGSRGHAGGGDGLPAGVDPMRTSFGYIGSDALQRQRASGQGVNTGGGARSGSNGGGRSRGRR